MIILSGALILCLGRSRAGLSMLLFKESSLITIEHDCDQIPLGDTFETWDALPFLVLP